MFVASIVSVSFLFLDEADRATDSEAEAEEELCTLREILSPGTFVPVLFVCLSLTLVSHSGADVGANLNEPNSELDAGQLNCRVIVM